MSKCVLVMDMPKCCYQCPCYSITECRAYKCGTRIEDDRKKPDWCPLKPIPSKKDDDFYDWDKANQVKGYNACIDELLKGEEG